MCIKDSECMSDRKKIERERERDATKTPRRMIMDFKNPGMIKKLVIRHLHEYGFSRVVGGAEEFIKHRVSESDCTTLERVSTI